MFPSWQRIMIFFFFLPVSEKWQCSQLLYLYCKWCADENQSDFLLLCRKSNRYKINHLCFTCFEEERLWEHCVAVNLGFLLVSLSLESCRRGNGFVCFVFWCQGLIKEAPSKGAGQCRPGLCALPPGPEHEPHRKWRGCKKPSFQAFDT